MHATVEDMQYESSVTAGYEAISRTTGDEAKQTHYNFTVNST